MTCQIALGPNDDLELILPSGRRLYIPIEHGTKYLHKILKDAECERAAERKGYIREFPTQHVIDAWLRTEGKAKKEQEHAKRAEELRDRFGLDLKDVEFNI